MYRRQGVAAAVGSALLAAVSFGATPAHAISLPGPIALKEAAKSVDVAQDVHYRRYHYRPHYRPYYYRPHYRPYHRYYRTYYYRPYYYRPYYRVYYHRPCYHPCYYHGPRYYYRPYVYYRPYIPPPWVSGPWGYFGPRYYTVGPWWGW